MPKFKLDDGDTILIRTIDAHEEAMAMARRLGAGGIVRTMVGKWEEDGQMIGFTKQTKQGEDDVLVEVFISKADEERREFDRYAVEMMRLIAENKDLKARLASAGEAGTAADSEAGVAEGESAMAESRDAQEQPLEPKD